MLAGRHGCPPVLYLAIAIVVVAVVLVGAWSRYHAHQATVRPPLHEQK